jgi:hypothetical protein
MELGYYISEIRQSLPLDWPHIDDRMIIRLINEFRTVYIKNHYNQNRTIDKGLTQSINMEVKPADQSTVGYISTSDRILKSLVTIPKIIKLSHRDLVLSTRNANILSQNYNYVTKEQAIYAGSGKVNKKEIFVFIDNSAGGNYLYIKTKKENPKIAMLTHVNVQAIFEDPLKCKEFHHPTEYIDDRDYEYPMVDTIWGYIKANILRDGLNVIQSDIQDGKEKEI